MLPGYFRFEKRVWENPWLDMLRALAIALVLARHGQRAWLDQAPRDAGPIDYLALNGWAGVDLFFVLSGFLIAQSLLAHSNQPTTLRFAEYAAKRALRILPAYYAVLFLVASGFFPGFPANTDHLGLRVVYHMLFLQDYLPSDINVVFWSLGVEEKFYLVAPAVAAVIAARKSVAGGVVVLTAIAALSPLLRVITFEASAEPVSYAAFWQTMRSPFHACLEPLLVGVGVAFLASRNIAIASGRMAGVLLAAALAVAVLLLTSHEMAATIDYVDVLAQPVCIAVLFGLMVFAAHSLKTTALPLEPVFRVGARLSFALYLVHYPLIPACLAVSAGNVALFGALYLGLSRLFALALHCAFEKPGLLWRKTLLARMRKPRIRAATPVRI